MLENNYAESIQGREIRRGDAETIERDNCMREALMLVRQKIALQVGNTDPVDFLTAKLREKFPPNWRNARLDFRDAVEQAISSGFIVFDDEHGVLQLGKAAEPGLNEMDIIIGSFGASSVRHWEAGPPPTIYCWYSGGLL